MQRGFNVYVAAFDSLKANLMMWPRHWLISIFNTLIFFIQVVGCGVDGRDPSRSEASRGHVGNVRSPSDGRDLHREMLNIGRCRCIVEHLHDRGPIEQRSRRDRAAITQLLSQNHSHIE